MGMSARVVFLRDRNDPEYLAKVKILRACTEAGIVPPLEIQNYFSGTCNEDLPLEIDFEARKWNNEYAEGYEIDIDQIPKGVKVIRFYNGW